MNSGRYITRVENVWKAVPPFLVCDVNRIRLTLEESAKLHIITGKDEEDSELDVFQC
jgi:hypothetical protein